MPPRTVPVTVGSRSGDLVEATVTSALLVRGSGQPDHQLQHRLKELVEQLFQRSTGQVAQARSIEHLLADRQRAKEFAAGFTLKLIGDRQLYLRAQLRMAELRLRTEREIGRYLAQSVRHGGGGDRRSLCPARDGDTPPGISRKQSWRWQKIAGIPDVVFEEFIRRARDARRDLSDAALLRFAGLLPERQRGDWGPQRRRERWGCDCSSFADPTPGIQARCEHCGNLFVHQG